MKVDEISYSTLINKAPYDKGIELFEEMLQKGLKVNVITFNTVLKKAVQNQQPLRTVLDLLAQMIQRNIKP